MRRTFTMAARVAVAAVAAIVLATPAYAQSSRPTVALLDLEFGAVQKWWEGNWDIGKGVADLIVDGLVEDIETLGYGYHATPASTADRDSERRDTYK